MNTMVITNFTTAGLAVKASLRMNILEIKYSDAMSAFALAISASYSSLHNPRFFFISVIILINTPNHIKEPVMAGTDSIIIEYV